MSPKERHEKASEVYKIVTNLPANNQGHFQWPGHEASTRKLRTYANAIRNMTPEPDRELRRILDDLGEGRTRAGGAARQAVSCGADPDVVLATARLILT